MSFERRNFASAKIAELWGTPVFHEGFMSLFETEFFLAAAVTVPLSAGSTDIWRVG